MIITVAGFKGGVGKTTTAVHLSAYLAQRAPTLLIDGDLNRTACKWAKRAEAFSQAQRTERGRERFKLPFTVVDEKQTAKFAGRFEHVVIDTQARPNQEELNALADGCDIVVLPLTLSMFALDALYDVIESLKRVARAKVKVVITSVPSSSTKYEQEVRQMLNEDGIAVFGRGIRRTSAFRESESCGLPLSILKHPGAYSAWSDYRCVGDELWADSASFLLDGVA